MKCVYIHYNIVNKYLITKYIVSQIDEYRHIKYIDKINIKVPLLMSIRRLMAL